MKDQWGFFALRVILFGLGICAVTWMASRFGNPVFLQGGIVAIFAAIVHPRRPVESIVLALLSVFVLASLLLLPPHHVLACLALGLVAASLAVDNPGPTHSPSHMLWGVVLVSAWTLASVLGYGTSWSLLCGLVFYLALVGGTIFLRRVWSWTARTGSQIRSRPASPDLFRQVRYR